MPEGILRAGSHVRPTPGLPPHTRHQLTTTLPPVEEARVQLTAGGTVFTGSCPIAELGESVPVPLPYDNVGAAAGTGARLDMDGTPRQAPTAAASPVMGGTYPVEHLPPAGPFTSRRITFVWPRHGRPDNVPTTGRRMSIEPGQRLHLLASAFRHWRLLKVGGRAARADPAEAP